MLNRILNKTPLTNEKSNVYEVDQFDSELLQQILQSRFIGEGVYGIEMFSMPDYKEQYFLSPSFDKYLYKSVQKEWNFKDDLKECAVFELVLDKPMFMPLDTKQFVDLFQVISNFSDVSIFTQILFCKRCDNWRELAITLYEQYLKGNDDPFESKFAIKLQEKMINVFAKLSNFTIERERINEMEQKILQNNYRFEARFVVFEEKYVNHFVSEMEKNLQKLNLFNEFRLKKVRNKGNFTKFIENREFQVDLVNQLLSEEEIYSLLCDKKPTMLQKVELEKPIKQQTILKQLQTNHIFSDAIQLLPFEEKKNLTVDKTIIKQMQQAFNRVKISKEPLEVMNVQQGSRLQKIEIKIPSDINYSHIKKNVENIQAALGKDSLSIEIADKPEIVNLYITCDDSELIYLKQILESPDFQEFAKEKMLPFIIGEDVIGKPLFACLSELRHLLICGATGSGKSVFLNCLLICLILYVNPDELVLYLIDPKMVELKPYEGFPQVTEVIIDMKKATTLLSKLTIEMDKRYEILSKAGYRDVMGYNKSSNDKIPYIVVVIDEYADLVETNPKVEEYIQRLGQKARGAGIHLVIATQRPSADILDGAIKTNLPSRISFKLETSSDYVTVFGKGIPFEPLGRGDGCARIETLPKQYQRFQSPIITLDDNIWKKVISDLKKVFQGVKSTEIILPEVESEIDKLKRIIATTGELRVTELGRLMIMGNNRTKELMQELVDECWLVQLPNKRYQINVSEDELSKWRDQNE